MATSDGSAVEDAEFEVVDATSGATLYVPDNRTSNTGFFLLTLPAGTYDLFLQPKGNDGLSPTVLRGTSVPQTSSLGVISLDEGFELRGRVRTENNSDCAGATIQLVETSTGLPVHVAENVTDSGGHYRMFVPSGTFDIVFSAPFSLPYGMETVPSVLIDDDVDLSNVSLPAVPFFSTTGTGIPGAGGIVPAVEASGGTPRLGNSAYAANIDGALGGALAFVSVQTASAPQGSFSNSNAQLLGKTFHLIRLAGTPGVAGEGHGMFPIPIGDSPGLAGQQLLVEFGVFDRGGVNDIARTKTMLVDIRP